MQDWLANPGIGNRIARGSRDRQITRPGTTHHGIRRRRVGAQDDIRRTRKACVGERRGLSAQQLMTRAGRTRGNRDPSQGSPRSHGRWRH
jgi:hypothetical protein